MNRLRIIFLGIATTIEEFYEIIGICPVEFEHEFKVSEELENYGNTQIIITEEEIKKYFGNYKNIKELRKKAIKYFADNFQGKTFDIGKFKNIRISKTARNKYESFSADKRKLLIVPKLLFILKNSKYKDSKYSYKNRRDNIFKFHYFTNEVIIKNDKYRIYITIGEDRIGKLFYDLDKNKDSKE